ncbi:archaeosortase/exosortase family protein [Rhodococcus pyridinivorans]|uniref:archaeosortase/exosortase family protein n=1 Tax=Rhodococcus pyridinivorans TaxID=103816 RepID=UPI002284B13B|nr:archaeosortase/exosortase family protein [Rhodococcus pyridinivorans]WAL49345.1 archaeosortase/exosortase family protein [Rhodococcus pyridinivorans]
MSVSVSSRERTVLFARTVTRWIIIVAATLIGYWSTWQQLASEIARGTGGGYVLLVPPFAVLAAEGVTRRRGGELPIHDRQTDCIVGGIVVAMALGMKALLVPRYGTSYQLMHLDVLSAWVFVLGGCVLLFGLRTASRYWPVWAMLLLTSPLVYRAVLVQIGGTKFAAGILTLLLAAGAITVAVGRTRRRAVLGFGATVALGFVPLGYLTATYPDARIGVFQLVPAGAAALVVGAGFYLQRHRGVAPRTVPPNPVRAGEVARTAPVLGVVAAVLAAVPLPDQKLTPVSPGPPPAAVARQVTPPGWYQLEGLDYSWPRRYFGSTAVLHRQMLRALEPRSEWDRLERPRTVAVQTLQVRRASVFELYPVETNYHLGGARVSPKIRVQLGHGVEADFFTVVDDELLLTWSLMSFVWERGPVQAQRVSLLTVDNHELDAPFPQPSPNMASNARSLLSVFLRGNTSVEDSASEYKDLEMLIDVGRELVEAQWRAS